MGERFRGGGPFGLFENLVWQERWPGLAAGITAAGRGSDFGLSTVSPAAAFFENHSTLARQLGFRATAMVRQVHEARVLELTAGLAVGGGAGPRLYLAGSADGLVADDSGTLLAVTAADCVPVYLVEPRRRLVGLLHAGWRGVAAGVLESALDRVDRGWSGARRDLWLHLGPAICGECYPVGPEVTEALGVSDRPPRHVDLRRILVGKATAAGLRSERVTVSEWCTRCGGDRFHSHRGSQGQAGRMAAYIGWRSETAG